MKTLINLVIIITLMSSSLSSVATKIFFNRSAVKVYDHPSAVKIYDHRGAVKIYGNRGARGIAPENTIYGYNTALSVGVDYVNMDIAMTIDGMLVVTHELALNPDLARDRAGKWITDESMFIRTLRIGQVQSYDVGRIKPDTSYSHLFRWKEPEKVHTPTPLLRQVIQHVKKIADDKVGFQIKMQTDPTHPDASATPAKLASALARVLAEEEIIDRTEVQAFDWRCLIALKKINPNIQTAWLTEFDYLKKMLSDNPEKAGLWTAGHLLKNYDNSIPKMIAELGGTIWCPEDRQLTKKLVKQAHKLGLKVVVWSNPEETNKTFDEDMMIKLLACKVDGIITDRPDLLRVIMAEQSYTLPEQFEVK